MTTSTTRPVKRGPGRPPKQREQTLPTLDAEQEPTRPFDHNGVPIVSEQLIGNLPKAPFRITRLMLANGTVAFGCRDCQATTDTRGELMDHRNAEHGAKFMRPKAKVELPLLKTTPDPVLSPREDGSPAPTNPLQMTLAEFLSLAPTLAALGDLVEEMQVERDAALQECEAMRRHQRENATKIAYYDQNREELANLRTWKRKMIKRFNDMGFSLNEEGDN